MCWDKQTNSIMVLQILEHYLAFHTEIMIMDNSTSSEVLLLIRAGSRYLKKQCLLHLLIWVLGDCTARTPCSLGP